MKILIIYSHPWEKSFNKAILDSVINGLKKNGNKIELLDLNNENFNPVLTVNDLEIYSKGESRDENVLRYHKMIMDSDSLIFIFPTWWAGMPALLKGFIDKVFIPGWAYESVSQFKINGKLTNIKSAYIITTMNTPRFYFDLFMKNPIKQVMVKNILKFCGIKNVKLFQFGRIKFISDKKRKNYLANLDKYFSNIG